MKVSTALIFRESTDVEVSVELKPYDEESRGSDIVWNEFRILSWTSERSSAEHCKGFISRQPSEQFSPSSTQPLDADTSLRLQHYSPDFADQASLRHYSSSIEPSAMYDTFSRGGIQSGPTFRSLSGIFVGFNGAKAVLNVPDTAATLPLEHETSMLIHPTTLDSCLQMVGAIIAGSHPDSATGLIPIAVEGFPIHECFQNLAGRTLNLFRTLLEHRVAAREYTVRVQIFDREVSLTDPVVTIHSASFQELSGDDGKEDSTDSKFARLDWRPFLPTLRPAQFQELMSLPTPAPGTLERLVRLEQASFYYIDETLRKVNLMRFRPRISGICTSECKSKCT